MTRYMPVDVLRWDSAIADFHSVSRADLEKQGRNRAPLDLLIASHALGADPVLVSNDQAFSDVANLRLEDWTKSAVPAAPGAGR